MAARGLYCFPPDVRLRRRRQFEQVRRTGRKTHTAHFIVLVHEQGSGPARLGVTVSRKVGCAVQRNRVKRLIREFFRRHQHQLPLGTDFSVIAKWGASSLDLRKVCDELGFLCVPTGTTCSEKSPSV